MLCVALAGTMAASACSSTPPDVPKAKRDLVSVPGLSGVKVGIALASLHSAGLKGKVIARQPFPDQKPGLVIDQRPRQDALVKRGTVVNLTVSQ